MPQTKSVIKGKSTVQDTTLSSIFLVRFRTFREKIRVVYPSGFVQMLCSNYLPQINRKEFRLKTLYVFLPCPCSFAVSMDVIVVHGMFLISCRIKYWAKFVIDSVLLIDTFFVLFRSSRGRYAGLIVPQDLF